MIRLYMYHYNINHTDLYIVLKKLILYILTWSKFLVNIYIRGIWNFRITEVFNTKEIINMSIYNDLKKAFVSTLDIIADKTSTQAQKSRLVTVMKNEEKIANQAYVALGKYLYSSLRDGMPEDVEQLCAVIDASKERMTRAQDIYREVIRQEEINSEIGRTEVKENFRKVKEPIVAGAVNTAAKASVIVKDTAKDTAAKAETLKAAAAERAEDIKAKMHKEKEALAKEAEEIIEDASAAAEDTEAIESAVLENAAPEAEPAAETEPEKDDDDVPMPVEMISEEEFEENEAVVKPIEKSNPITKAKKLKDIMTKKDEE